MAPLLGRKGVIRTARGNREGFLQVLQHMLKALRGYSIRLYVDGANWHKGEAIRLFLQRHTRIQRSNRLEYLPPYQPALNEQECLWRQGNYAVSYRSYQECLVRQSRHHLPPLQEHGGSLVQTEKQTITHHHLMRAY